MHVPFGLSRVRSVQPPHPLRCVTLCFHLILLNFQPVRSQSNSDIWNPSTTDGYKDMRQCARSMFEGGGAIHLQVQCSTNACMCRDSVMASAIPILSMRVSSYCSNLEDVSTAISVMTAHCSSKGFALAAAPTTTQPTTTGAYGGPIFITATVTKVVTETVRTAAAASRLPDGASSPPWIAVGVCLIAAAALAPPPFR